MTDEAKAKEKILTSIKEYYETFMEPKSAQKSEKISYAGRIFDHEEVGNLVESALDFWLTEGRYTAEFERSLCSFLGAEFCVLTNSGSSANLLAASSLTSPKLREKALQPGDEVITVASGFPTTVAPIVQNRLVPVFIDVDPATYNADVSLIKKAISPKTRAIMLAHTLGNPFDLEPVMQIAKENNLWVVEDNCDALGSTYAGKKTGTFGDLSTYSFYPAHHITMGEGGAVVAKTAKMRKIVDSFRSWGRDCWCPSGQDDTCGKRFGQQLGKLPFGFDHKYTYSHLGYNLKATEMQAAIGCAQIKKLPEFIRLRKQNFATLLNALKKYERFFILPQSYPQADPAWFGFILTVREGSPFTRRDIVTHLESRDIQTRNLFAGNLVKHQCFEPLQEGRDFRIAGSLDNTDTIMKNTFWVGVYPGITAKKMDRMIECFESFLKNK